MKYFTPDLLAKCRSLDPDVAEAAAAKWQERAEAYRERLREIYPRLPRGARQLIRSLTLHDAYLLIDNLAKVRGRTQFFLLFQLPGGDGRTEVQVRYDLVTSLKVVPHEPHTSGDRRRFALYDEFDISADGTLTHSILMTGGVEIRVRFAQLRITRFTQVRSPVLGSSDIKRLVEMAAS